MSENRTQHTTIYCIGDSHASFFSGSDKIQPEWPDRSYDHIPSFRSYRVGASTAYNLSEEHSSTRGREKVFEILSQLPKNATALLCFGEIDCRVHLLRQSREKHRPLEVVVRECVERYMNVVKEIKEKGFDVIVYEVIASTLHGDIAEKEYRAYGTCIERNEVTKLFNTILKEKAKEIGVSTIGLFDYLVERDGTTDTYLYSDKIHLSQRAMPLFVKEINKIFPQYKIVVCDSRMCSYVPKRIVWMWFIFVSHYRACVYKIMRKKNKIKVKIYRMIKGI